MSKRERKLTHEERRQVAVENSTRRVTEWVNAWYSSGWDDRLIYLFVGAMVLAAGLLVIWVFLAWLGWVKLPVTSP